MGRRSKSINVRPPPQISAIAPKKLEENDASQTQPTLNDSGNNSGNSSKLTPDKTALYMNKLTTIMPKPAERERVDLLFPCYKCEFSFQTNASLVSHIRMMHPIVPKSGSTTYNPNVKNKASTVNPSSNNVQCKRVIKLSNKSHANIQGNRTIEIGRQTEERTDESQAKNDRKVIIFKSGTTITKGIGIVKDNETVKPTAITPKLMTNPFKASDRSNSKKIRIIRNVDTAKAVEITPIITSSTSLCTKKVKIKSRRLKNVRSKKTYKLRPLMPKLSINEPDDNHDYIFAEDDDDQYIDEDSNVDPLENVKVEIKDETIEVEEIFNQDIHASYETEQESPTDNTSSSQCRQLLQGQATSTKANTANPPESIKVSAPVFTASQLKYVSLMKQQPKILPRLPSAGYKEPQPVQNTLPASVPVPVPQPVSFTLGGTRYRLPGTELPKGSVLPRGPVFVEDAEEQFESDPEDNSGLTKCKRDSIKQRKKRVKDEFKRLMLLKFRLFTGPLSMDRKKSIRLRNMLRNYGAKLDNFFLKEGKLFVTKDEKQLEVVLYWKDMQSALEKFHTSRGEGKHLTIRETENLISQVLIWRGLKSDVLRYVRDCTGCITPKEDTKSVRQCQPRSEMFERWSKKMNIYKYKLEHGKWPAKSRTFNQGRNLHLYKLEGGKLMVKKRFENYKGKTGGGSGWVQVIYNSLDDVEYIMSEMHRSDSTDAIHLSKVGTARKVGSIYYWKLWRRDVFDFIARCSTCNPIDNYCDDDGFFCDTALSSGAEVEPVTSFTPGNNWDAETRAAIAGICDTIQPKKVNRGAFIKKSTKSKRVVNEELKEKMDEISDATEQRFCKLDSHMARLRRLNVDRKQAEAVRHFLDTGEWTRSVREAVQGRLANQLNNKEIKIENGVLKRFVKGDINDYRIVLTDIHHIQTAMRKYHKSHNGAKLTTDAVRTMYYWRDMTEDIIDYVKCCSVCKQKSLMKWNRPQVEKPTDLKVMPSERIGKIDVEISLDLAGPFVETVNGNRCICIISDNWSKFSRFFGQSDVDSLSTAESLTRWIFQNGPPKKIITGQSDSFNEALLKEVQSKLKINQDNFSMQTYYADQVVKDFKATLLNNEELDLQSLHWDQFLEEASYCFNTRERPGAGQDQNSSSEPSPLYMRHFVQLNNVSKMKVNQREEDPFYKKSTCIDFTEPHPSHSTTQGTSSGESIDENLNDDEGEHSNDPSTSGTTKRKRGSLKKPAKSTKKKLKTAQQFEEVTTMVNESVGMQPNQPMTSEMQTNQPMTEEELIFNAAMRKLNKPIKDKMETSKLKDPEAKINEPMTSWMRKSFPILAQKGQDMFQSMKPPMIVNKQQYQQMTAEKHRNQPMTAVMQQSQPLTAVMQQNQPMRAVMQHSQPMTGVMQQNQTMRAVMQHSQPMTDVVQQNQPMTAVMQQNQPMTAVMQQNQPMTAVVQQNQPMTAVMQQNQTMTAVMQQNQPMTAVMQQTQPMTSVNGLFIPAVSLVQSGQPVYRSIQQLPIVGQLSRPIVQPRVIYTTILQQQQQITASLGQQQQQQYAVFTSPPQPNPSPVGARSIKPMNGNSGV